MSHPILAHLPYIGPLSFHAYVAQSPVVHIEAAENFQKATYRNRAHIMGANGLERLSIPIEEGRGLRRPIKEVRISYAFDWQKLHWNAITSAYNRSPFFEFYEYDLRHFFVSKEQFLFDFNLKVLQTTWQLLGLNPTLQFTSVYEKESGGDVADVRAQFHPNKDKVQSVFFTETVPYYQVFQERHGFEPDLCAWDLLFNEGPNSSNILRRMLGPR